MTGTPNYRGVSIITRAYMIGVPVIAATVGWMLGLLTAFVAR